VLKVGRDIYVGITPRTNNLGAESLTSELKPLGYNVRPVTVKDCLHFKSACTAIDNQTLLVNPDWIDLNDFEGFRIINIDESEPWAGKYPVDKQHGIHSCRIYENSKATPKDLAFQLKQSTYLSF